MKFGFINQYKPLLVALKKAGFKAEEMVKQGNKTIITISPVKITGKSRFFQGGK